MRKKATIFISSALIIGASACGNGADGLPEGTLFPDSATPPGYASPEVTLAPSAAPFALQTPVPSILAPTPTHAPAFQADIPYSREDCSTISIIRSERAQASDITDAEIEDMVRESVRQAGGLGSIVQNGDTVVLKPNLVQNIVDSTGRILDDTINGITTDYRVTRAVARIVRELNPDGDILVMEACATGSMREIMAYYHYTPEDMPEVDAFVSLNEDNGAWQEFDAPTLIRVPIEDGLLHKAYYFNRRLYEADVLISIPCLKTTNGMAVTGGIKNFCIGAPPGNIYGRAENEPGKTAMVSHSVGDGKMFKWMADYYRLKPVDFVVVDGLQGFQRGPIPSTQERSVTDRMNMRLIMAGSDAVALDSACALMMGWDPQSVGYLKLFGELGLGNADTGRLIVNGIPVDAVRTPFLVRKIGPLAKEIPTADAPRIEVIETLRKGDTLIMRLETGGEVVKAEVYVDGRLRLLKTAGEGLDVVELALPDTGAAHTVTLVGYDRFLNEARVDVGTF